MYFEKMGKANTDKTLELALATARERGIGHLVVATTVGDTILKLGELDTSGLKVVFVTHAQGFAGPGENELSAERRAIAEAAGFAVFTGTHALSGGERGISSALGGAYPLEIVAHALRMMGQGTKVCVECAVMAIDAGLIPHGEKIIAVGGTGRGADTALILSPAHANKLLETRIHEIICKPAL